MDAPGPPPVPEDASGLLAGAAGELDRWAAEARADEAAAARARERWLRHQAGEDATLAGVLVDLAERDEVVVVHTSSGRRHRGRIVGVASDHVALAPADNAAPILVAWSAIVTVQARPTGRAALAVGDRETTSTVCLPDALADLAADRARVQLVCAGASDAVVGLLVAVGRDVVTLRLDGEAGSVAYVPVASIAEVVPAR